MSLLGMSLAAIAITACEKQNTHATDQTESAAAPDVYTDILGIVASLDDGMPASEFKIHHEHIPGFKTRTGEVNVTPDGIPGMKAMVMPFPVAESVDLSGIEVGDKVRFSFVVNWGGSPPWQLTAIEEIDPSTEISFENKAVVETGEDAGHDDHHDHDHHGHDHGDHDHDGP